MSRQSQHPTNKFKFYSCGRDLYPALKRVFLAAKKEILINVYAFHNDEVGRDVAATLIGCAKSGVKVRVLFDSIGSWGDQGELLEYLRRGGVEAKAFRDKRTYLWKKPISFLYRDHARLFLVDRKVLGLGGVGIGEIYVEREDNFWLANIAKGEAMAELFDAWWRLAEGPGCLPPDLLQPHAIWDGLSILASGPARKEWRIYDWILERILRSRKRVVAASAWFFPDTSMTGALRRAVERGVEVEIITPLQTDREAYDGFRALPLWTLLKTGLRWYGTPKYFHQKLFVFDDDWMFGSANWDMLSLQRNYELNVFGHGGSILKQLESDLSRLKAGLEPLRENPTPWVFRRLNSAAYKATEYLMSASPLRKRVV